jgi:methylenetetrahydrofolate dehydrogenase (NADP+)/methenyltetrahydrofolate cyclohydrolase
MIVDGKAIAEDIYSQLAARRAKILRPLKLGIIVGGPDPVIEQFVRIKTKAAARLDIEMVRVDLPLKATTEDVLAAVRELAERTDALIVQLPLPKNIDVNATLSEIPSEKDVDAINPRHSGGHGAVDAPVAEAAIEVLKRSNVEIKGKRAVVIGAGRLVGAPSAVLLKRLGADVSMFTLQEGSIEDLKDADIVVCGAGNPGFVKPEHLKHGVALIDAGASEQSGKVVGDADPKCASIASVFTPVPGGIGPIAVALIFKNLLDLIEQEQ